MNTNSSKEQHIYDIQYIIKEINDFKKHSPTISTDTLMMAKIADSILFLLESKDV